MPSHGPPDEDSAAEGPPGDGTSGTDFVREVREARAGRRGLIANIPGMVYQAHVDATWPMEFVSAGARELTGYPAEDFLADGPRSFGDVIHAEDQERVWADVQVAVEADRSFSLEYRIHHADGTIRHVWDHGHPVFDEDGRVLCVEGIILDVTERVMLAEQLRHAQRRETVGRLSGVVAHDFNNYLTGIIGSLELALADLADGAPARESVKLALDASRKARDLTRQLLLVSRSRPQKREVVDLSERVRDLHTFLSQVVGSPVDLRMETGEEELPVFIDPVLVDQIVLNLVVNAREALGGYGSIVIRSRPRDGQAVLEVQDDGHGMDEATQRQAFEPFFTTKASGTGLGLATVKTIATEMGGSIGIESAPGEGCLFRVALPLAAPADEGVGPAPSEEAEAPAPGDGQTILVVDDDPTVLRLVTTVLRRFGYHPEGAADPDACRAFVGTLPEPPALTILDVTLPGCSGIELAEELERDGLVGPTLFMSGYAPEELVTGTDSLRDTAYLEKPFSVDELLAAVSRVLAAGAGPSASEAS